jgi:uroporphyrinogen-III synthase
MFAKIKSRQQNTVAQIFCTQSGWTRDHLLRKEADDREVLSLLAQRDGMPEVLVMDGPKAQTQGEFRKKCHEFDIHVKQLEAYDSKSNAAECGVRELKRGTGLKQLRANIPKVLWDPCVK